MQAASWASPLIVEDKVYIGDEDGDISIFKLSKDMQLLAEHGEHHLHDARRRQRHTVHRQSQPFVRHQAWREERAANGGREPGNPAAPSQPEALERSRG